MDEFAQGQQPCERFVMRDELFGSNRHQCFGPYTPSADGLGLCGGAVSFCDNCTRDHHTGGWDSCPQPRVET